MKERKEEYVTKEDIKVYLRMINDYKEVDVLYALEYGDFTDMPFSYLEYVIISILPADRHRVRGRNSDNNGYKVSEVYDAIGMSNIHSRLEELVLETAYKLGQETANHMINGEKAKARRVPIQILSDIKSLTGRFYEDREERKTLISRSLEIFRNTCVETLGKDAPEVAVTPILQHVESVVTGTLGEYNSPQ